MNWTSSAMWWHVYPLGFCGAPIRDENPLAAPRLQHLLGWLDYAVELGVNGVLLGPIFASQTHGYDSLDHFRIDPRLGDHTDFDTLIDACATRGIRVVLDGVFSHVSSQHPDLLRALRDGQDTPSAALFDIDWQGVTGPTPRVFEGHEALARLDHTAEETAQYVRRVMNHWLQRGIDGWRLDAAYSVATSFWSKVLPEVRANYPDAWFLGEVIHGDYSAFVDESGMDTVTQYELWKAIWSSLTDRNLFELDWALRRHNQFLASFTPQTFVGNHDVTRIATRVGQDGAVAALAILLTVGGVPSIYAGDEQGFVGIKEERLGGDDAVRPPFPDKPSGLADWGAGVFRSHQQLIGLRRQRPWLVTARTEPLALENEKYTYRVRASGGDEFLDVTVDLHGPPIVTVRDHHSTVLWSPPHLK